MTASPVRRGLAVRCTTPDGGPLVALEVLALEAGLHPELVRRLIALGALEPRGGTSRAPQFPRDAAARLARVARLRRDLGVNYAGALPACDLLARIEALEDRLARCWSTSGRRGAGPCRMVSPVLERLAARHTGQFKLVRSTSTRTPTSPPVTAP